MVIAYECASIIEEVEKKVKSLVPEDLLVVGHLSRFKLFHYQPIIGKQFCCSEVSRENFNIFCVDKKIDIICSIEFVALSDPYDF